MALQCRPMEGSGDQYEGRNAMERSLVHRCFHISDSKQTAERTIKTIVQTINQPNSGSIITRTNSVNTQLTANVLFAALALQATALPNPGTVETTLTNRCVPGQCGAHIRQYQRKESPGNQSIYRLTIELEIANGADLGGVNTAPAPSGERVDVDSALPAVFIATTGYVDSDPVSFAYNGQNWDSSSGQCSFGAYDSVSRQRDCGFSC